MTVVKTKRSRPLAGTIVTLLVAIPLFVAPTIVRGLAANAWVNHYAAMDPLPRPRKAIARAIVEKANAAIHNLAPLPQASSAARQALEIGQRVQNADHDREAALVLYQGVRAAAVAVQSRPLSGTGFAVIEARAAALEESARPEPSPKPQATPAK